MTALGHGELLTNELMGEFWEGLASLGAPVLEYVRPGLPREETVAAATAADVRLTDEMLVWWSWHDGADNSNLDHRSAVGPTMGLMRLEEALRMREMQLRSTSGRLRAGRENRESPPYETWLPAWVPILRRDIYMVCADTSVGAKDATPLRAKGKGYRPEESHQVLSTSMGTMVRAWIDAIRDDHWYLEGEYRLIRARYDYTTLPADVRHAWTWFM